MGAGKKVAAAIAGLVISFALVAVLQSVTPQPGLEVGTAETTIKGFAFEEPQFQVTAGSRVYVENDGAVPVTLIITAPDGTNSTVAIAAGAARNITLDAEGTHQVHVEEWPWMHAEWEVLSDNPFVRFWERLF